VTFVMDEDRAEGQIRNLLKKLRKRKEQHFLEKVTAFMQQKRQFAETDEIVPLTEEERNALVEAWPQYLASVEAKGEDAVHYMIKDMAVKHGSGTASIGLDRYYVLIEAGGAAEGIDDIVLEVKEVRVPVPAYFLPYDDSFWSAHGHQGKRVVMTQKAMHHEADPYLGCLSIGERHFYVRERSPYKKRLKLAKLETADAFETVVDCMGRLTAKLHARADVDVRQGILAYHSEDEIVLAMGDDEEAFCATIAQWALAYAGQVERDYEIFVEWAGSRRKS